MVFTCLMPVVLHPALVLQPGQLDLERLDEFLGGVGLRLLLLRLPPPQRLQRLLVLSLDLLIGGKRRVS